jgi:hypothetical protein
MRRGFATHRKSARCAANNSKNCMKVVNALAAIEFRVGSITRESNSLVVASRAGQGVPTQVYVRPQDVLQILKAVFMSRAALGFLLLFPLYWWRARREPAIADHHATNNPWK